MNSYVSGLVLIAIGAFLKWGLEDPYALSSSVNLGTIGVILVAIGALIVVVKLISGSR